MSDKNDASGDQPAGSRADPDATLKPGEKPFDPDDTLQPVPRKFDPDITVTSPQEMFDPDATIGIGARRRRANPFAPKALPEALQANLAALGGLNPLVAFANPVFGVVPEIRAAKKHPDPALLKETLQDLVEAFEAGASAAGMTQDTVEAAVYALCCLSDDAAAATPWGADWLQDGLLQRMRDETRGGFEFFALLEKIAADPQGNADLLEFMYVCLALGFEGRYRDAQGGRAELERLRADLHAVITRRRPRPVEGLSVRWRGVSARPAPRSAPVAERSPMRYVATAVAALLILVVAYAVMRPPAPSPRLTSQVAPAPAPTPAPTPTPTPTPAPVPTAAASAATMTTAAIPTTTQTTVAAPPAKPAWREALAPAVGSGLISVIEDHAGLSISIRDDRQFAPGGVKPDANMLLTIEKIAAALDGIPGEIVVVGHTSTIPVNLKLFPSNDALSLARAEAVARLLGARLRDPGRVKAEGAGERDRIAPDDTPANRGRNRRVVIRVRPEMPKGAGG